MAGPRILVVGGHTRNIGKTALVCDIIGAFPEAEWTAVKITQYGHGVCSVNGEHCGCAPQEHAFSLDEEAQRNERTDTSRFLTAGARRSLWLRTKQGQLAEAIPRLRQELAGAGNVIIESNSVLGFLRPQLYIVVLHPTEADFKDSARRFLDLASAYVLRDAVAEGKVGSEMPGKILVAKPQFIQPLRGDFPPELRQFVRQRFFAG